MGGILASGFWGTALAQLIAVALVGLAAFALGWLLFGTAMRAKKDREIAARMATVTRPNQQPVASVPEGSGGWIPAKVTRFGRRFAESRGFSGRVDAELEAAGVSVRSGEFVVLGWEAAPEHPATLSSPAPSRASNARSTATARVSVSARRAR